MTVEENVSNEREPISNEIVDKLGRTFKLKEITGKSRVAFYRALGAKDAANLGVVAEYWNVMAVDTLESGMPFSIKALVDIEYMHGQIEKGEAMPLIEKWLADKADEKQKRDADIGEKNIKK
jgi:hypothetical protein